jgi:hypothetical protein
MIFHLHLRKKHMSFCWMVSPTRVGVIAWALLVAVFVTTVTLSSGSSSTPQFATRSKYHKHNNHRTTKMGLNETSGRSNMNGPKRGAGNVLDSEYYGSDDNDNSACGLYVWDFFSATKYHMCRVSHSTEALYFVPWRAFVFLNKPMFSYCNICYVLCCSRHCP